MENGVTSRYTSVRTERSSGAIRNLQSWGLPRALRPRPTARYGAGNKISSVFFWTTLGGTANEWVDKRSNCSLTVTSSLDRENTIMRTAITITVLIALIAILAWNNGRLDSRLPVAPAEGQDAIVAVQDNSGHAQVLVTPPSNSDPVMYVQSGDLTIGVTKKDLDDAAKKQEGQDKVRFEAFHKTSGFADANKDYVLKTLQEVIHYLTTDDYANDRAAVYDNNDKAVLQTESNAEKLAQCVAARSNQQGWYDGVSLVYFDSGDAEWGLSGHYYKSDSAQTRFLAAAKQIRTDIMSCLNEIVPTKNLVWNPSPQGNLWLRDESIKSIDVRKEQQEHDRQRRSELDQIRQLQTAAANGDRTAAIKAQALQSSLNFDDDAWAQNHPNNGVGQEATQPDEALSTDTPESKPSSSAVALPSSRYSIQRSAATPNAMVASSLSNDASVKPSFDCTQAHLPTEREICTNPVLAKADVTIASMYKTALAAGRTTGREQIQWLNQRNECAENIDCIARAETQRIHELHIQ